MVGIIVFVMTEEGALVTTNFDGFLVGVLDGGGELEIDLHANEGEHVVRLVIAKLSKKIGAK